MPHCGQSRWPSSSRAQNTTVTSPSTAASVIVTPNSTVRTIVSATTTPAQDVGSDTGLPGGGRYGVDTCILCPPGPVSAHRHDLPARISATLTCTPFPEEPLSGAAGIDACGSKGQPIQGVPLIRSGRNLIDERMGLAAPSPRLTPR